MCKYHILTEEAKFGMKITNNSENVIQLFLFTPVNDRVDLF